MSSGLIDPVDFVTVISPSDTVDLTYSARAVWCAGAGTMKATFLSGTIATVSGITAGSLLPFQVRRIWSTGTTCSGILALR